MRRSLRLSLIHLILVTVCLQLALSTVVADDVRWSKHTVVLDGNRTITITAAAGYIRLGGNQAQFKDEGAPGETVYRAARVDVVRTASEIPLNMGTTFGAEYQISGLRKGEKVRTIARFEFPPSPDGKQLPPFDLASTESNGSNAAAYHTFRTDEPELNLRGVWKITYFIEGQKVVSHEFCIGSCSFASLSLDRQ